MLQAAQTLLSANIDVKAHPHIANSQALSSISTLIASSCPLQNGISTTPNSSNKWTQPSDFNFHQSASLKKRALNFDVTKWHTFIFLWKDEVRLADEEDQTMALVTVQNAQDHEEANNIISKDVHEVFEWEQLIDRTDDEDPHVPINVTIIVDVKKVKVQEMKAIFQKRTASCQEKAITIQDDSWFQQSHKDGWG